MRPNRRPASLVAVAVLAALALAGCSGGKRQPVSEAAASIWTVVPDQLTVCVASSYPPFVLADKGETVGFDIDLIDEVAKDMGVKSALVISSGLEIDEATALDEHQCDVAASAIPISDGRSMRADFSAPYFDTSLGILTSVDSGISSVDDLADKVIGYQADSDAAMWARARLDSEKIQRIERLSDMVAALEKGEVAGILHHKPVLEAYQTEDQTIVWGLSDYVEYGFMVKRGNTALLDQINATLVRVHSGGIYDGLIKKWFAVAFPEGT